MNKNMLHSGYMKAYTDFNAFAGNFVTEGRMESEFRPAFFKIDVLIYSRPVWFLLESSEE